MEMRKTLLFLRVITLIIMVFLISEANSRTYNEGLIFGARSLALGGCSIVNENELGSIYSNPAGLALMGGDAKISLSYNNQFGITGWDEEKLAFAVKPWGPLRIGFLRNSSTAEVYEEAGVNLWSDARSVSGIGIKLSERMAIGGNFQKLLYQLKVGNETYVQDLNLANFGCLYLGERFSFGLALHNWELSNKEKHIGPSYHLGLGLRMNLVDYKLEISNYETAVGGQRQWSVRTGMEFDFAPGIVIRLGSTALDETRIIAVGLGISIKNVTLDYAYTTPYKIRSSHQITTTYHF